jgi:small subunit ribosomal protein S6
VVNYETTFIIDPNTADEAVGGIAEKYSQQLTALGAEVLNVDLWGKRKLAFEIKGKNEGFYITIRFNSTPDAAKELNRVLKLSDEVVRALLLRLN